MAESPTSLRDFLAHRKELTHLIIVAIILALGIELIAAEILLILPSTWHIPLFLGMALVLGAVLLLLRVVFKSRRIAVSFQGALIFDPVANSIIPVREYEFSERVHQALQATFLENKAVEVLWKAQPLSKKRSNANDSDKAPISNGDSSDGPNGLSKPSFVSVYKMKVESVEEEPKAARILREAVEFVVLEKLSTHLSDYFKDYSDDDEYIKQYRREDVPSLLLENRVLSLLTTPLENRAVFVEQALHENQPPGEVCFILGSDGSMYSRFDLVLPRNTRITRPSEGVLILENNRISLKLSVNYAGFATHLPPDFLWWYVGVNLKEIDIKLVVIELDAEVRRWGLISNFGWNYYQWIDSFVEELDALISEDSFLKEINWKALSAQAFIAQKQQLHLRKKKVTPPE